ncbi:MAG: Dabb family protein [Bacillus sp. (in: Bacteria)]|nr:Dabb family protein [Bacillus sp. (in: firmicutes)]MCM1426798.1 Dabb family protein [Eubacterium sp.]
MVHHIVLWNLKETLSEAEKKEAASRIKKELEALKGQIPGLVSIRVVTDALSSANRDVGLIAVHESEDDLKGYQVHPAHVAAASYVRSVTCDRICFDYEEELE